MSSDRTDGHTTAYETPMTYTVTITPSHTEVGKSLTGDQQVLSFSIEITDPCVDVTLNVESVVYEGTTTDLLPTPYEFTYQFADGRVQLFMVDLPSIENMLTYTGCPTTFETELVSVLDGNGNSIDDHSWLEFDHN